MCLLLPMKSFYIWLGIGLCLIGCSKNPANKVVENSARVVSAPTPEEIKETNAKLEEIKKTSDKALKIKQQEIIRNKLDILIKKVKYKQRNPSQKDLEDIKYILRTVHETCSDAINIRDVTFEALQDCENFIDRSNSTLQVRLK